MVRDMTEGKPLRLILSFSLPILLGNLFQQFYNMADTIIVGKCIGVQALAAVGSTGSLNFLIMGFATGTCSGLTIPMAQYFGARDEANVRRCAANALYVAGAVAVALTALTMLFTRQILEIMQTPADIFQGAYDYIIVIFGGMGVEGAAYATVLSQAIAALLCVVYAVWRFPILRLRREDWRPSLPHIRRMTGIGLPMGLQFSITAVGSIILQSAVNMLGSQAVAAVTAGSKVQMILTQPLETLGVTMATYCGQNLGALKLGRIRTGVRQTLVVSLACAAVSFLIGQFAGQQIALLFLDAGETVILGQVGLFLLLNGVGYPLLGTLLVLRNALQGLGYAVPAMAAGLFELAGRAAVAFCLVGVFGFPAVCLANMSAWIMANVLLIPVFLLSMRRLRHTYPSKD